MGCDQEMSKRGRTPVTYTRERAEVVRRRVRQEGERITAVCADLGMNYENFLRWCRRNNFQVHTPLTRAKRRATPRGPYPIGQPPKQLRRPRAGGRAAAIVEDWQDGRLAPGEIAKKHDVCYVYVLRLRRLVGLNPPAGKGRNISNPDRVSKYDQRNSAIIKTLAEGKSVAELARRYRLSRQSIYNIKNRRKRRAECR